MQLAIRVSRSTHWWSTIGANKTCCLTETWKCPLSPSHTLSLYLQSERESVCVVSYGIMVKVSAASARSHTRSRNPSTNRRCCPCCTGNWNRTKKINKIITNRTQLHSCIAHPFLFYSVSFYFLLVSSILSFFSSETWVHNSNTKAIHKFRVLQRRRIWGFSVRSRT